MKKTSFVIAILASALHGGACGGKKAAPASPGSERRLRRRPPAAATWARRWLGLGLEHKPTRPVPERGAPGRHPLVGLMFVACRSPFWHARRRPRPVPV
jgi:hypothetical protein